MLVRFQTGQKVLFGTYSHTAQHSTSQHGAAQHSITYNAFLNENVSHIHTDFGICTSMIYSSHAPSLVSCTRRRDPEQTLLSQVASTAAVLTQKETLGGKVWEDVTTRRKIVVKY